MSDNVFVAKSNDDLKGDLSSYDKVITDFEGKVDIDMDCKLPKVCDFSKNDVIVMRYVDTSNIESVKLKEGGKVWLGNLGEFPKCFDLSKSKVVKISRYDMKNVESLRLMDGADLFLEDVKNVPADNDIDKCENVWLHGSDTNKLSELKFRDGANVSLKYVFALPEKIDVSNCNVDGAIIGEYKNVKTVICKNKAQMNDVLKFAKDDGFTGKVIDDEATRAVVNAKANTL